jgi:hypothetical protein
MEEVRSPEEQLISSLTDAMYNDGGTEKEDEEAPPLETEVEFGYVGRVDFAAENNAEEGEEPLRDNADERLNAEEEEADTVQVIVGSRKAEAVRRAAVNQLAFVDVGKAGVEKMKVKYLSVSRLRKQQ